VKRVRVRVSGRVQGVSFRDTVAREARSRDVAGWVRNCADGTVEAVFEGEPDAVEQMVEVCGRGPRGAEVERLEADREDPERLAGFRVR
jgi:acylphosphatase